MGSAIRSSNRVSAPFAIPCVASASLSSTFGLDVSICDVTLGPTSSWKDCVAPGVVEEALSRGLRRVVVASSGNHGRAIAFACRAAGLRAAVLVYERTPRDVVESLLQLGADVFRYADRVAVHAALDDFVSDGWFSATLMDWQRDRKTMPGSDGYRRISEAIVHAVSEDPVIIVSTCYGDGVCAIQRYLRDLNCDPQFCLVRASGGAKSLVSSIATETKTLQVAAMIASGAWDVQVEDRVFRSGLSVMETALDKRLDCAEGGFPEALERFVKLGAALHRRPVVCVVTGGVFSGLVLRR